MGVCFYEGGGALAFRVVSAPAGYCRVGSSSWERECRGCTASSKLSPAKYTAA